MTRLEKLESQLAQHRERIAEIEGELPALAVAAEEARVEAIRKAPGVRSDVGGANNAVGRLNRKIQDRERELVGLRAETAAVASVIADERKADAEDAFRAEIRKARGYRVRELDLVGQMAATFDAFADSWLEWAAATVEADNHAVAVDHGGLLSAAPNLVHEWLTVARPAVQPVPLDFMAAITKLVEASADPQGVGTRIEGGVRRAGYVLPTLIAERPELNSRLGLQGVNDLSGNFERCAYDRMKPNENNIEPSSSETHDVAAELAAELFA